MTLVKLNHPRVSNALANRAWFESFVDSNLGNRNDCRSVSNVKYQINDNDTNIELEMVVAGFSKEDLLIELDNDMLTIKSKEIKEGDEMRFGQIEFEKRFKISDRIIVEEIKASVENGILTMVFPKVEKAIKKPARSIEIE